VNVRNKVILVTGGAGGLGAEMVQLLCENGAKLYILDLDVQKGEELEKRMKKLSYSATFLKLDLTSEEAWQDVVARIVDKEGRIDVLVNSQGIVHLQPSEEFDTEIWQRVMDVNIKSLVLCCKHVGRVMLAQGKGKIINMSSVRGFQGRIGDLAYAPSKGAVNQLTHSLAIEWGPRGINVNAIAPAFTLTDMSRPSLEDPVTREWVLSRIPMKRTGELEDFFGPVVFLASDASSFVNGHVLMVDGGWLAA